MSVDGDMQEPFELNIASIQGKWLCEELGVSLSVVGQTVQYSSGEVYSIEVTPEGKLEIFGYRGLQKKSDASSITWKHKENGSYLTWMYEGDSDDVEPEVDAALILHGSTGRRKRKVDYVALDKELDEHGNSHPSVVPVSLATPLCFSLEVVEMEFSSLKRQFTTWVNSTDTDRCREILSKRGYVSTNFSHGTLSSEKEGASRFVSYMKSLGVRATQSADNTVQVRVPESVWKSFLATKSVHEAVDSELVDAVEKIKAKVIAFCENPSDDLKKMEAQLDLLDSLPVDVDILKLTKIGVEINKLSKYSDRAKSTLSKLKDVYMQSKK